MRTIKTASLIICILLMSTPAYALEALHYSEKPITEKSSDKGKYFSWDETNTKLQALTALVMFIDMKQTEYNIEEYYQYGGCRDRGDGKTECHAETNPYLSKYPSKEELREAVGLAFLGTSGIAYILPPKPSHIFQGGIITIEILYIGNNFYLGAKIKI